MAGIPPNPFILVDGSSYLFRAYHALPPLSTSKGQPTGAIFGVVNMLRKLLAEYQPTLMAVVFDSKEKNFRHVRYPEYKANRIMMPDALQQQIELLYAVIKAMGIPLIMMPGVEADDIIGTLAIQAKAAGLFTLISTGDKDFAQLVDEHIFLINTMTNSIFDRNKVIQKFEVAPEQIIDYLTLIGDTVDNIPGVAKVGPKTAVKWLQQYGSLEAIIQHAEEIPGKVGENLRHCLENLPLFKELITIQLNVPVSCEPHLLKLRASNVVALRALYTELEFKTWLKNLEETEASIAKAISRYEMILTKPDFERWLERLKKAELIALDTETTSLDYMLAEIVGVSMAITPGEAVYIPLAHDYEGAPKQLPRAWVLEQLKALLEGEKHLKVGHNLKYDIEVLANHGIHLQGIAFDTMLESYVLDSTGSRHDMDTLAQKHLNYKTVSFEEVAGKGIKQLTFNQVPLEKAGFYAAEDADIALKLHNQFWPLLQKYPKQKAVFETIEMPLVPVLARMESTGVLIDARALTKQSKGLSERLKGLEKDIHDLAGQAFNINSPKQLQAILFKDLKLPVLEKTPTGQPSTAESVLQELADTYEFPKLVLEFRSLTKLKSTYTDRLPEQINPKTGRVHTSYHQAITATGRLSSTDPNLQNIPVRSVEGRRVRSAFIAPPHYKIIAADYSQIELRIMAHLSQDPGLHEAFVVGDDIHKSTAAAVYDIPIEQVTSEQRRNAKIINFGLMYGMSAFGLAKQLSIKREEAEKEVARYFTCFPRVKSFIEEIRQKSIEQGFVETVLGRRLYLPDLQSPYAASRRAAERAAINAPMQGTNADIIKLAMIRLDQWILKDKMKIRMIMQVHDELVFEVADDILIEAAQKIREIMETVMTLSVPLSVGIGMGNNWDEAH